MDTMNTHEMISALADGQLEGDAFAQAVAAVTTDPAARQAWQTYHLIGDVLRSGELATTTAPPVFLAGFQARLQQELAAGQPAAIKVIAAGADVERAAGSFDSQQTAANDASFRWKMVAGVASLAAVSAIGWSAWGLNPASGDAQLAKAAGASAVATAERPVMIRDPRLDELLAAHRQLGGASALQMPAGFLRNATFEGPGR
jgi:sigma-E factor negative regulatory protein RseA